LRDPRRRGRGVYYFAVMRPVPTGCTWCSGGCLGPSGVRSHRPKEIDGSRH
jgi:hypothetical protein